MSYNPNQPKKPVEKKENLLLSVFKFVSQGGSETHNQKTRNAFERDSSEKHANSKKGDDDKDVDFSENYNGGYSESSESSGAYSSSVVNFLAGNTDKICERMQLILQKKPGGTARKKLGDEIVAYIDKLSEYNCNKPTRHKKVI